jgi:Nickel responsive protein SCO4226-like
MPRYLIERFFGNLGEAEMQEVNIRANRLPVEEFPDIEWDHSHVCILPSGEVKSFCIYTAPSEERIREHAEVLGYHAVINVLEITEDVKPQDVVG